jgi:hypothetical protein
MIKVGIKGKIIKGVYSPKGELVVEDNNTEDTSGYYIYVWPNDNSKWPGTDKDMVYDTWLENWNCVESQFKYEGWEIEWYDEESKLKP